MIQQQRQRIEQAVTEMINDMDKTHLRKMQVNKSRRTLNSAVGKMIKKIIEASVSKKISCNGCGS